MFGFTLGGYEWVIVLVVALLLFGHRIPSMARSLGSGIVEFKKGLRRWEDSRGDDRELPSGTPSGTGADDKSQSQTQPQNEGPANP